MQISEFTEYVFRCGQKYTQHSCLDTEALHKRNESAQILDAIPEIVVIQESPPEEFGTIS